MTEQSDYIEGVRRHVERVKADCALAADSAAKCLEYLERSGTLADNAAFYFHLKTEYEALDDERKRIYEVVDRLNKGVVPAKLEQNEGDMFRMPSLGRSFYIVAKNSASILNKEKAFEWLCKNGLSALITETVNSGTLASALTEKIIKENIDPPADIFKYGTYNTTGMSKYTPKKDGK